MTQAHLAAAAGISERTVRRIEEGIDASDESIRAVAAVLGIPSSGLPRTGPPAARLLGTFDFHHPDGTPWVPLPTLGRRPPYGLEYVITGVAKFGTVLLHEICIAACHRSLGETGAMPKLSWFHYGGVRETDPTSLWDVLPPARRAQVTTVRVRNQADGAINPFDTAPGCRLPTPFQREILAAILSVVVYARDDADVPAIVEVANRLVEEAYAIDRPYEPGEEPEVDAVLARPPRTWWEAVDALMAASAPEGVVALAQGQAVPRPCEVGAHLDALVSRGALSPAAARVAERISALLPAFLERYPMLSGPTRERQAFADTVIFDLEDALERNVKGPRFGVTLGYLLARTLIKETEFDGRGGRMSVIGMYDQLGDLALIRRCLEGEVATASERGVRVVAYGNMVERMTELPGRIAHTIWAWGHHPRSPQLRGVDAGPLVGFPDGDDEMVMVFRDGAERARISFRMPYFDRLRNGTWRPNPIPR